MAQPLTVLQTCVLIASKPELESLISPELFSEMAGEIERVTTMYRRIQELISSATCSDEDGTTGLQPTPDVTLF